LQVGGERERPEAIRQACEEPEAVASGDEQNATIGFGGLAQPERLFLNAL
jgi:hypothetical protein